MPPTPNRADPKDSCKIHVLPVDDNEAFPRATTEFSRDYQCRKTGQFRVHKSERKKG
jgi:hypothetical protein